MNASPKPNATPRRGGSVLTTAPGSPQRRSTKDHLYSRFGRWVKNPEQATHYANLVEAMRDHEMKARLRRAIKPLTPDAIAEPASDAIAAD